MHRRHVSEQIRLQEEALSIMEINRQASIDAKIAEANKNILDEELED